MSDLIKQLNRNYFWDIKYHEIDQEKSKRLIIERVFNLGNLNEIKMILNVYGKETVVTTLCNLNYIEPKTLNFASLLFQIPKSKFKCYTKAQSISQPLNY